ncbi:YdaU family protein [Pseudomonas cannabina]|uniref:YdaU family protein n=1 Tax=Pseudomonas cannabina pv. alisalensis TaxID=757414 RepID=A0ABS1XFC0_PSEC1|nr:YdaU family protein [Pseudomonas cannabina]MBM0140178.1 YdaU family protein [Pseudomonas cannabina pv. alisalensis]
MNFFPFHPGDYMLRTAHLDPFEDLAYRRLIDLYYVNESPLQGNAEELSRVIRLRKNADQVAAVLQEFFVEKEPGLWSHSHCDEVIDQYRLKAKQAAENGKRGGRPKKTQGEPNPNPEETQPVISANPAETGLKANQEPITNNHKPIDQKHTAQAPADELFPKFWKLYPNKKGKTAAEKAWKKLKVTDDLFTLIAQGLAKQCASLAWTKDNGQFIPHPATWLNGKRWEDEVQPVSNVHQFPQSRHTGFDTRDYKAGLTPRGDGTYDF